MEEKKVCEWQIDETDGVSSMNKQQVQRRKLVDKIAPWKDSDHHTFYLKRFEDVMTTTGIPTAEWPSRLLPLLTGKVISAYTNNVPRPTAEANPTLKDALLNDMGLSKECCMYNYLVLQRGIAETWQGAVWHVESMGKLLGEDCTMVAECILTFNMSKFFSLYSTWDTEYVQNKIPKSLLEVANILEDHQATSLSSPDIDIVMAHANHSEKIDGITLQDRYLARMQIP